MSDVRQWGRGRIGGMSFADFNILGKGVDNAALAMESDPSPFMTDPVIPLVMILATGSTDQAGSPLGRLASWESASITSDSLNGPASFEGNLELSSTIVEDDQFSEPAVLATPPLGLMIPVVDTFGTTRPVYVPVPSVVAVTLTAATPPPTGTYDVTAIDDSFSIPDLTPQDRIPSVPYSTISTHGMLMLVDEDVANVRLYAFEPPDLAVCPPPPQATAAFGGFAV